MPRKRDSTGKSGGYRVGLKERSRRYYCDHREEVKKKREEYYLANRELKRQYNQAHYNANRERVKEKRSEHYKAHKDAMKQKSAQYYKEHREMRRKYALGYYATHKDEKAQYYLRNRERLLQYQRDYVCARENMEKEGHVDEWQTGGRYLCQRGSRQGAVTGEKVVFSQGSDCVSREDSAECAVTSLEDKSNGEIPTNQGRREKKDARKKPEKKYPLELSEKEVELA